MQSAFLVSGFHSLPFWRIRIMTVRIASSNLSICPMYEELGFLVPGNFAGDGNRFRLRLFDNGGFLGTFSFDGSSVISFRHVLVWHL